MVVPCRGLVFCGTVGAKAKEGGAPPRRAPRAAGPGRHRDLVPTGGGSPGCTVACVSACSRNVGWCPVVSAWCPCWPSRCLPGWGGLVVGVGGVCLGRGLWVSPDSSLSGAGRVDVCDAASPFAGLLAPVACLAGVGSCPWWPTWPAFPVSASPGAVAAMRCSRYTSTLPVACRGGWLVLGVGW